MLKIIEEIVQNGYSGAGENQKPKYEVLIYEVETSRPVVWVDKCCYKFNKKLVNRISVKESMVVIK
jgi:hypothetical protein